MRDRLQAARFHRVLPLSTLALLACAGPTPSGDQAARPTHVVPNAGYSTGPTSVEIDDTGFLVKATQSSGGDRRLSPRTWAGSSSGTWPRASPTAGLVPRHQIDRPQHLRDRALQRV